MLKDKLNSYLQLQLKFTSSEAAKIIYGLQGLLSELSKLLIILAVSFPLGNSCGHHCFVIHPLQ